MARTTTSGDNRTRQRLPRWLFPAVGYAVSIACLIWVYSGFDWKREWPKLSATDPGWVIVAVVSDIAVYFCQGWRWNLLLSPLTWVSVWKSIQAVYIGLFANEILPLRSGEVIRCYLMRRWGDLPFSVALSSALIERLMDGVWLVLGFYLVAAYVDLPGWLVGISRVLLIAMAVVAVLVAWAVLHKSHAHGAISRSRWAGMLRHVVDGTHAMGNSSSFAASFVLSLVYLLLQVLPVYALVRGYGLDVTLAQSAAVLVVLRLGTVIPQAPGNVGSFQALTILGLQLFGVDRSSSTGFATLLFLVVTVPLWMAGFVALLATRMRLGDIHREAREQMTNGEPAPGRR